MATLHKNFITPLARASYAHVWEKSEMPNGDMKFNIALLIPKSDKEGVTSIKAAIESAAEDFFGEDKKKWPSGMINPLRDGDDKADEMPSYADNFYLNAKSDRQPGIVGPNARPLMDQDDFYSGCWCLASLNFFGYNKAGNKGVGVGLNNLMKKKDDDRLDGKRNAESEFGTYADKDSEADPLADFGEGKDF